MDAPQDPTQKRVLIGLGVVVAVVALILGIFALAGGDDDDGDTTTTIGSSTTSSVTSTSTTVATTTTVAADDLDAAVFPDLTGTERFGDPVALARAFATGPLGFRDDLTVGSFAAGDSRSGEVEVSAVAGQPTTVLVRQLGDGSWFVIGATTETIVLSTPANRARITSVQPLLGEASAFEGHVAVALYADGRGSPIATTFVTGRGDGVLGPFEGELAFDVPDGATHGTLVLTSPSGEDGSTISATAIRVRF